MKKIPILLTFLLGILMSFTLAAQPFAVGETSETFTDPARGNRSIPTAIYYPATSAGNNTPAAMGEFPLIIFGHGFLIGYTQYEWLAEALVPCGYIVAFPNTETGFPNHANFGGDLAFLVPAIRGENTDATSPLFGIVGTTAALGGHSMGGGASFLGAENNTDIDALFNFAAAETNTSAIAAAANVLVPTMVIEGSDDCVTPSASHSGAMYDNLSVSCRTLVNITGGSHCQFANADFTCGLGQFGCGGSISLAAQEQEVIDHLKPWLDTYLKGDCDQLDILEANLIAETDVVYDWVCPTIDTCNVCLTASYPLPCGLQPDSVSVAVSVLLEGTYDAAGTMRNSLGALIPLSQPYNAAPYNYTGTESIASVPADMVDWVLVEMRSGTPDITAPSKQTVVEETRAAILLTDGRVVDVDGVSPVAFKNNVYFGSNYYICVRHRNHLDVVSATSVLAQSGVVTYDFTTGVSQALGAVQQALSADGRGMMFAGEYTQDGIIQLTDRDDWRVSPAILNIYNLLDGNLDGVIQVTDYDAWYPNRSVLGINELDY